MEVKTIYHSLDSNKLNFVLNKMLAKSIVIIWFQPKLMSNHFMGLGS